MLLDTGGGLKKAKWFFDDSPFIIYNVDINSDIDLAKLYSENINKEALATLAVTNRNSSRVLLVDNNNILCGWKNKKTNEIKMSRETKGELIEKAFSGIHIVNPAIFNLMPEQNVFSIIDLYLSAARENIKTIFDHNSSKWIDAGKPETLKLIKDNPDYYLVGL